jgi:hypothetical protein
MIVYLALYNDCNLEGDAGTLSIHRTLKGAEAVIKEHRQKTIREHRQETLKYCGMDIGIMETCGFTWEEIDKQLKERLEEYPHDWQYWGTREMEISE